MFLRSYTEMEVPFEVAERVLLRAPDGWLPEAAGDAERRRERLLADVGFGRRVRFHRPVEVEVRPALRLSGRTVLPIAWHSADREWLFPTLEADLELAPLSDRTTQIALTGRYSPPLGSVGRAVDRAVLHRVAEATVRDFVDRVAARIRAGAPEVLDARAHLNPP